MRAAAVNPNVTTAGQLTVLPVSGRRDFPPSSGFPSVCFRRCCQDELARVQQDPRLAQPLFEGTEITGAELLFGIRAEGAATVEDLLERRTRLALVPEDAAKARAKAAQLLALGTGSALASDKTEGSAK
jgi:glycerol-3-phosphate dehydrogenase